MVCKEGRISLVRGGGKNLKILAINFKLNVLELQMKSKKKVLLLALYISNFQTYTRYFGVEDEKQKINKS